VDEVRILRLLAEYCQLVDDGRFDEVVRRFTTDGTLVAGRETATGRDAVKALLQVTEPPEVRGKHLTTNSVIDVAGDRARAVSDFAFLVHRGGSLVPLVAGRYRDSFRRVDDVWQFERREADVMRSTH
jgi:hypothetical protein